uniref:Uncharacterized protein n=1 Tax=Romanomermis culicivorax TaxID=13658 RepID=A0A915HVD9_ROMCU
MDFSLWMPLTGRVLRARLRGSASPPKPKPKNSMCLTIRCATSCVESTAPCAASHKYRTMYNRYCKEKCSVNAGSAPAGGQVEGTCKKIVGDCSPKTDAMFCQCGTAVNGGSFIQRKKVHWAKSAPLFKSFYTKF